MILIKRVWSVEVIPHIASLLTFNDEESRPGFLSALTQQLQCTPHSILLLLGLDGDEIKGLIIAKDPGIQYPYIVLAQAFCAPDTPLSLGPRLFARTAAWAMTLEKTYIRAETKRSLEPFQRRYNFEPMSTVMRCDLTPEKLVEILNPTLSQKEPSDG